MELYVPKHDPEVRIVFAYIQYFTACTRLGFIDNNLKESNKVLVLH